MSAPFIDEQFTFIQPDGTSIDVRGSGDQFSASFTKLDGTPLVRNEQGFYVEPANALLAAPADLESSSGLMPRRNRWEIRRNKNKREARLRLDSDIALAPPARQTIGTIVGLTLLVEFPGVPATIPQTDVDDFCNASGYTGYGNNGSVRDYFSDI